MFPRVKLIKVLFGFASVLCLLNLQAEVAVEEKGEAGDPTVQNTAPIQTMNPYGAKPEMSATPGGLSSFSGISSTNTQQPSVLPPEPTFEPHDIPGEPKDLSNMELIDILDTYDGRWEGTFEIRALDGTLFKKIKVEMSYWWAEKDKKLDGLVVFDDAGILRYQQSSNYVKDGKIMSEVVDRGETTRHRAEVKDNSIIWYPTAKNEALDMQVTEYFYTDDAGEDVRRIDGFERAKQLNMTLLVRGLLHRAKPEPTPVDTAATAQEPPPATSPTVPQPQMPQQVQQAPTPEPEKPKQIWVRPPVPSQK